MVVRVWKSPKNGCGSAPFGGSLRVRGLDSGCRTSATGLADSFGDGGPAPDGRQRRGSLTAEGPPPLIGSVVASPATTTWGWRPRPTPWRPRARPSGAASSTSR